VRRHDAQTGAVELVLDRLVKPGEHQAAAAGIGGGEDEFVAAMEVISAATGSKTSLSIERK
jgi:hypothetical protein